MKSKDIARQPTHISYLTLCDDKGEYTPHMSPKQQVKTEEYFALRPVFALDEAAAVLRPFGGKSGTIERLKHHIETGRLKRVAREVYAVVPLGQKAAQFQPDMFLIAQTMRPDGIFCCHSALELLGMAHSVWNQTTLFCVRRRQPLVMDAGEILFFDHPAPLRKSDSTLHGVRKIEYHGHLLRVTGLERTLVDGFTRLDMVGGFQEFIESVSGFPVLDLDLLESVLELYATANLWAAVGWFLEKNREMFHVPESFLARIEVHRPRSPQYLIRSRRGGRMSARWNLVLPPEAEHLGESDER